MSPSPTLSRTRTGFWLRNRKPRRTFSSSASSSTSRIGEPVDQAGVEPGQDDLLALVRLALGRRAVAAGRLEPLEPALGHRQVGQDELEVEPLDVPPRVDRAIGMRRRGILECAHDMEQGVRVAQPGEVLGGQLLGPDVALGRGGRRRQVGVGDVGLDDLLRLEDRGEALEPRVGDLDDADVELHPAESAGLGVAPGQRVEDGGLTRSGKPDDRDLHAARLSPIAAIGVRVRRRLRS